ncbi:MAG: HAMP domain-containing histidine kinase [Gemmatimonadaceae bacterium]|nr:HAMP domain-containing histidine kinase [Gemmatimonadaceae bacterium]
MPILLLAVWLRNPLIPYGGSATRASEFLAAAAADEGGGGRSAAIGSLRNAIAAQHLALASAARRALDAPPDAARAFEYLKGVGLDRHSGVVVLENGRPLAWNGQLRTDLESAGPGTTVTMTPFYVSLNVSVTRGSRRAVASALLHAEPPADRLAERLDAGVDSRESVEAFVFAVPADTAGGEIIAAPDGRPMLRVDAAPRSAEAIGFDRLAAFRARGTTVLAVGLLGLLAFGWTDRRRLGRRLLTLAIVLIATALVPWNNFSNVARIFDPAYYFWSPGGPLSANAGVLLQCSVLLLLAVFAIIRARLTAIPRVVAAIGAFMLAGGGFALTALAATGIALPPWGYTIALWLSWQIPLFLILFAFWLGAAWLARIALGRLPTVHLRNAALVAMLAALGSAAIVWRITTIQRLALATRDMAGLQQPDGDASLLLRRFGEQLTLHDSAGTRADLLKRYAASDLAAAGLQVSLGIWSPDGAPEAVLDLAPLVYDSSGPASAAREAIATRQIVVRHVLAPTGRQVVLAAPHRSGAITTALVSPRTRLVAPAPFSPLLGFTQPALSEPPYTLTLADVPEPAGYRASSVGWRRIGDEWHGDQLIESSRGIVRAHAEVDLRSGGTRVIRGSLIVILDTAIAGLLWALGAMAEGGFFRWTRLRVRGWIRSYRGRLTLALFTFFVVPALAFAAWSSQRLRDDDRDVRERLIRETLQTAVRGDRVAPEVNRVRGDTPLFLYGNALLRNSSDSLYAMIAPNGRVLPADVHLAISARGELTARSQQTIAGSRVFWGYMATSGPADERYVLAAPSRSDELALDRRRRDLTLLVLFATAIGAIAALWLSGKAAKVLARDLELSRVEVARAERVIAWGEMARQVAHEIKNPLTPIRLGVQHLRRARKDPRVDFDHVLNENVTRILAEIDRLDEIARAFSRYGSAPADLPPPERIDVAAILRDVVALEKIGIGGVSWAAHGVEEPLFAHARGDELREVLLNVFENARLARARNVSVSLARDGVSAMIDITDDGGGISPGALPRVFEPHFSTRTTGSGLGLAISRRLLESWGGSIDLISEEGRGARVIITLSLARA